MRSLIFYILATIGTVALFHYEVLQVESTQRDVASIYLALHGGRK